MTVSQLQDSKEREEEKEKRKRKERERGRHRSKPSCFANANLDQPARSLSLLLLPLLSLFARASRKAEATGSREKRLVPFAPSSPELEESSDTRLALSPPSLLCLSKGKKTPPRPTRKRKTQENAPTTTTTEAAVVELRVDMACSGCEAAVRRVLEATPGVSSVSVDLAAQRVRVGVSPSSAAAAPALTPEEVLAAAAKSGKKAELWS